MELRTQYNKSASSVQTPFWEGATLPMTVPITGSYLFLCYSGLVTRLRYAVSSWRKKAPITAGLSYGMEQLSWPFGNHIPPWLAGWSWVSPSILTNTCVTITTTNSFLQISTLHHSLYYHLRRYHWWSSDLILQSQCLEEGAEVSLKSTLDTEINAEQRWWERELSIA